MTFRGSELNQSIFRFTTLLLILFIAKNVSNPLSQAMDNLFELHDWPAPLQMMDAAVNYYELDDERYLRLRIRVNDRLIKDKRIDDLYASRHYGQLMLYVSAFQFFRQLIF